MSIVLIDSQHFLMLLSRVYGAEALLASCWASGFRKTGGGLEPRMVEISFRTSGWIEHGLQISLCPTTKFISLSKVPPKLLKRSPFRDLPLLMGYVLIFSSNGT